MSKELSIDKPVATEKKPRQIEVKAGKVAWGFRLKMNILVEMERTKSGYLATVSHSGLYRFAEGSTEQSAIEELISALGDCRYSLEETHELDDSSLQMLYALRKAIERA